MVCGVGMAAGEEWKSLRLGRMGISDLTAPILGAQEAEQVP